MRFAVRVLACVGAGAVSLAVADPSTTAPDITTAPPAAPATAATSTTPRAQASPAPSAAPTSAATAPVKPVVDPEEKRLIAMGYKPEMRNGERVFCRREEALGSRLAAQKICGTEAELKAAQSQVREDVERAQRLPVNPMGH